MKIHTSSGQKLLYTHTHTSSTYTEGLLLLQMCLYRNMHKRMLHSTQLYNWLRPSTPTKSCYMLWFKTVVPDFLPSLLLLLLLLLLFGTVMFLCYAQTVPLFIHNSYFEKCMAYIRKSWKSQWVIHATLSSRVTDTYGNSACHVPMDHWK